jgi:hypothetical protein
MLIQHSKKSESGRARLRPEILVPLPDDSNPFIVSGSYSFSNGGQIAEAYPVIRQAIEQALCFTHRESQPHLHEWKSGFAVMRMR